MSFPGSQLVSFWLIQVWPGWSWHIGLFSQGPHLWNTAWASTYWWALVYVHMCIASLTPTMERWWSEVIEVSNSIWGSDLSPSPVSKINEKHLQFYQFLSPGDWIDLFLGSSCDWLGSCCERSDRAQLDAAATCVSGVTNHRNFLPSIFSIPQLESLWVLCFR